MSHRKVNAFVSSWRSGSLLYAESLASLGVKYCACNALSLHDFYKLVKDLDPGISLTKSMRASNFQPIDTFKLARILDEPTKVVKTLQGSAIALENAFEFFNAKSTITNALRICEVCWLESSYHSLIHQSTYLNRCFVHNTLLRTVYSNLKSHGWRMAHELRLLEPLHRYKLEHTVTRDVSESDFARHQESRRICNLSVGRYALARLKLTLAHKVEPREIHALVACVDPIHLGNLLLCLGGASEASVINPFVASVSGSESHSIEIRMSREMVHATMSQLQLSPLAVARVVLSSKTTVSQVATVLSRIKQRNNKLHFCCFALMQSVEGQSARLAPCLALFEAGHDVCLAALLTEIVENVCCRETGWASPGVYLDTLVEQCAIYFASLGNSSTDSLDPKGSNIHGSCINEASFRDNYRCEMQCALVSEDTTLSADVSAFLSTVFCTRLCKAIDSILSRYATGLVVSNRTFNVADELGAAFRLQPVGVVVDSTGVGLKMYVKYFADEDHCRSQSTIDVDGDLHLSLVSSSICAYRTANKQREDYLRAVVESLRP